MDPLAQQRLAKLKELEAGKRKHKNAKLGMLTASDAAPVTAFAAASINKSAVMEEAKPQGAHGVSVSPNLSNADNLSSGGINTPTSVKRPTPPVGGKAQAAASAARVRPIQSSTKRLTTATASTEASSSSGSANSLSDSVSMAPTTKGTYSPSIIQVKASADAITSKSNMGASVLATPSPSRRLDSSASVSAQERMDEAVSENGEALRTTTAIQPLPTQDEESMSAVKPAPINMAAMGLAEVYDPNAEVDGATVQKKVDTSQSKLRRNKPVVDETPQPIHFEVDNAREFVYRPVPHGKRMLCKITRNKSDGMDKLYPLYDLFLQEPDGGKTFLMSGRKKKTSAHSTYVIALSNDTERARNIVGKVSGNFMGTEFVIYDNGFNPKKGKDDKHGPSVRRELGSVLYEANVLGLRGPRKMTVLVPGMTEDEKRKEIAPQHESQTILSMYKYQDLSQLTVLNNQLPQWNQDSQAYVLDFHGRVTMASVKNFQIVHANDCRIVRGSELSYRLTHTNPQSGAFALVLTSFDSKLACE